MFSVSVPLLAAAEEAGGHGGLPFAPIWFGVIALAVLFGLVGVLWAFRNSVPLHPADLDDAAEHFTQPEGQGRHANPRESGH